jgi:DNA repair protein RadA/Sms
MLEVAPLTANAEPLPRLPTGVGEVDRVLGGGLVPGEALLLAGEPGIGKSTLVLQLIAAWTRGGHRALLITGEESRQQVALRAARMRLPLDAFWVAASSSLSSLIETSLAHRPDILIVDSVQTLEDARLEQPAGSPVQVRECAAALVRHAKSSGTVVLLIGHVTKDGSVAGPKTLEHVVDAVMTLEGEGTGAVRFLRAVKNRFGGCDETGVFVMRERGLAPVEDPSAMLLADRRTGVTGSVVFPTLEGTRPVLTEIQALVCKSSLSQPRRVATGMDPRRLALLLGVLDKHGGLKLNNHDVFVAAAGGLDVREPAADLALSLALFSAAIDVPVDGRAVVVGEVGLGGEVRRVPALERRLAEAARLGFSAAIGPPNEGACETLRMITVDDIASAQAAVRRPE